MITTEIAEHEAPTPPAGSAEPSEPQGASDETTRLEERRRDAYRVR
jgi:hypothetical protein